MADKLKPFSIILFSLLFLQVSFLVLAQESSISVKSSVNKQRFSQDEPLTFKIEISGNFSSSPRIDLPDWKKDFNVVSTAQSQSLDIKGKNKIRQIVLIYVLTAKSVGRLSIGEVTIRIGKEIFKTPSITVEVIPSVSPLPAEPSPQMPMESDQEQFII